MTEGELQSALRTLAGEIDYPRTPDIGHAVGGRLMASPRMIPAHRRWPSISTRAALVAAAAVLLAIGATVAAIPAARSTLAHWFHVPGVVVNTVPSLPPAPGSKLDLGERTTLSAAHEHVDFAIKQPRLATLGSPDAVYLRTSATGSEVSFVYRPRAGLPEAGQTGAGLLVSEVRGTVNATFMGKLLAIGTGVKEISVNGQPGYWIQGEHEFFYEGPNGEFEQDTLRLSASALIWSQNGVVFRIEGNIDQSTAVAVAASLH